MSTQHTPGPWKAHATGLARSGLPEFEIHWSDIGECVAEIVHGEANARLIAAAPELLEALQDALVIFEFCEDDKTVIAPLWVKRARAAITKATGGAA